jgi:hypothetical protein
MILRAKMKYCEENLSQCHFVHKKSHPNWPGFELRPPLSKAGDCLSRGMAGRESEICYDVAYSVVMAGMNLIFL